MATLKRVTFGKRTTTKTLLKADFGTENTADHAVIFFDEKDDSGRMVRHSLHLSSAEREKLVRWLAYEPS